MSSIGVSVTARPVRVGWCIRHGDLNQLRRAVRLTSMLWGGRYNPIIPVDDVVHAEQLVRVFHVDMLYPAEADATIGGFLASHQHRRWPRYDGELLTDERDTPSRKPRPTLLDTQFVLSWIAQQKTVRPAGLRLTPRWDSSDHLADALLVNYGEYPNDKWGDVFRSSADRLDLGADSVVSSEESLPYSLGDQISPLDLTEYRLERRRGSRRPPGVFLGSCESFDDLLACWNLNAAGNSLRFVDLREIHRQVNSIQSYINVLEGEVRGEPPHSQRLSVWSNQGQKMPSELSSTLPLLTCWHGKEIWNGLNIRPPIVGISPDSTIANVSVDRSRPSLTFHLAHEKALGMDFRHDHQRWIITVRPYTTSVEEDGYTFATPNIPQMNGYYGREIVGDPDRARVEPDGLGILTQVAQSHFTLYALSIGNLFQAIFSTFGMETKPSVPGLVAKRLIRQMGGLQQCRVFKIAGVRKLIGSFSASTPFTYFQASNLIREGFQAYESLFMNGRRVAERDVFQFLLEQGVFRTGMEFRCPACELDFWVLLDDVKTHLPCEFCGASINVTTQLPDRNAWRFRRSGLFGRDNHQEGGIPVCLALQRFDTTVRGLLSLKLYSTGIEIQGSSPTIPTCEIDFVFLHQGADGRVHLALGEAKGGKEISSVDVANIEAVAAAFPPSEFDVFPTFVKTGDISASEIERCIDSADTFPPRRILLTTLELEPYDLHERYQHQRQAVRYAAGLEEMAEAARELYGAASGSDRTTKDE